MSPLFTYNNKLLLKDSALSADDGCCCCDEDVMIDDFIDGSVPPTTTNLWSQGIGSNLIPITPGTINVSDRTGIPLNGVLRKSRELGKTGGGGALWSGIGTGSITLKVTTTSSPPPAWDLRYDGLASNSDSNFFTPRYRASCYNHFILKGMSSAFNGKRLITTIRTRPSGVNYTYRYTIDPIALDDGDLFVAFSGFNGITPAIPMPPKFGYLVFVLFRFEGLNNTAVPASLGTSYTINSIEFHKEDI